MTNKILTKINIAITLPVIAGILLLSAGFPSTASAAALTGLKDTMSTLHVGSLSTHKIEFAAATAVALNSGKTFIITFPTAANEFDFTGKTLAGMTISHGGAQGTSYTGTLAAVAGAANQWGAVFSGTKNSVLTLTFPTAGNALVAGEKVVITYSSTLSVNPTVAGPYTITIAGTAGDTGSILLNILTDDQVLVSAVVQQTLSFSLSSPTIGFGQLTPGTPKYANTAGTGVAADAQAHTISVATNAAGGYNLTYAGPTLTYGANTITAIGGTATAPNVSAEQFGLRAIATGGTGVVQAPYSTTNQYAFVAGTAQNLAQATGPSDATTYDLRYIANAISTTEAGSYSAALTFTATANY